MGTIVAGIGASHVPSVGPAYDTDQGDTDTWRPLFEPFADVKVWLRDVVQADIAIVIYNDHGTDFFFDKYPTFAIGVGDEFAIGDEGFGTRPLPTVKGDPDFAWHVAESLIGDEFDLTVCQEMAVDHGLLVPLPMLWDHDPDWAVKVVPFEVNVLQHPLPTARRCHRMGQALRRAVESYPDDVRVVIVGTGGMSHQLNGERFGFMNADFDQYFLDQIIADPAPLVELSHHQLMTDAGAEGVELIMWLAMRGAMAPQVQQCHRSYYAPMTTGMGLITMVDAPNQTEPERNA